MTKDNETSNFAEAAIQYVKETDYIDDLNRNLAGNAFLAGCEHGYRVGKDEIDQLKARLEDAERALKFYADNKNHDEPYDGEGFGYSAVSNDDGDMARAYFAKHPQDGAKE